MFSSSSVFLLHVFSSLFCSFSVCFFSWLLLFFFSPSLWKIVKRVFLVKLDASAERGIRGYKALALMSVMERTSLSRIELLSGPRPALKTTSGALLKCITFWCLGEELRLSFTAVDVKRPILSVSSLTDRGSDPSWQAELA